jgi:hypothetical protein
MQIISADERLREVRGVKMLLLGETAIGKTWQAHTLDPAQTLFIDCEAGDLSILGWPAPTIRIDNFPDARDLACRIGGPNNSFPPTAAYSPAHFEAIGGYLENLDQYQNVFVDSLTAISRLSFRWAEQQPESFSERTGRKDLRSTYGLHGREMILWLNQLQHARAKNVIFVGILERVVDELKHVEWQLQAEGSKTSRELPASSTRSSHTNFSILATASRQYAVSSAPIQTHGAIPPRIAAVVSIKSSRPISASYSANSPISMIP